MAKKETTEEFDYTHKKTMSVMDGLYFGFGFFLANLAGFLIIIIIAWIIIVIAGQHNLIF